MKNTLLASVVLGTLMAGNALAADMAVKAPFMKAPPMPAFSWSGFYIGGHAGCGWADSPSVTAFNSPVGDSTTDTAITTERPSGCFSGGQIGADYQFAGGFVLGVMGDIAWGKISGFHQVADDFPGGEFSSFETKLTSLGSVRGRIGYAINGGLPIVGGVSWMPYFTGGWAWATSKVSVNGDAGTFTSDSQTLSGWTLGGGFEYAINPSLSWKAEYLYTRFDSKTYSVVFDDDGVPPGLTLGSTNVSTFKTGLNWRFGH